MKKLFKNKKRQVVKGFALVPGMKDKDGHKIPDSEEGLSSIEDASHDFMINSQRIDTFHDHEKTLSKKDAVIVENHITLCDFRVNIEDGIIEPHAVIMAKELDGILQKAEGDKDRELMLAFELLKNKMSELKLIKSELQKKDGKWKLARKGSWFWGLKVFNKDVWDDVDSGILRHTSIEGEASEWEDIDE